MNAVVVNTTEAPFATLPNQINIDPIRYYKTTRDVCYWTHETNHEEYFIHQFVNKAREFNYTEEQALGVLTYNNYDYDKSECDLHIYRPIKGLAKVDVKQIVKIISDGIAKTVKTREHRDFDDILLMFPGFTIGDVLGAYSKHRFLIKKQTYRVKKAIKKSISKPSVANGSLKDNEFSWNESCSDTQFQMLYQKHFHFIENHRDLQEIISRDLTDMKQSGSNGIKLGDLNSYVEADGMLNLLRKMNRKRNKFGSTLDKAQLLNILNSVNSDKITKPEHETLVKEEVTDTSPCGSSPSTSPNADRMSPSSKEPTDDNHFEEKLHDYVKGDIRQFLVSDEPEFEDGSISNSLKELLERHETVLSSFANFLPDPNEFQQLSHSWDNMDFSILLLGLSEHGKDFDKISDAVFTKSKSMIHSFYMNFSSEFSLDEIAIQPLAEVEVESLPKPEMEESALPTKIKVEEYVDDQSFGRPASNTSSENHKRRKKIANKKKSSEKSKTQSSSSNQSVTDDNHDVIITRSLRSRTETNNEIMKSLIDQEKKSYNRKSRKTAKRNATDSRENNGGQAKRNRRN